MYELASWPRKPDDSNGSSRWVPVITGGRHAHKEMRACIKTSSGPKVNRVRSGGGVGLGFAAQRRTGADVTGGGQGAVTYSPWSYIALPAG